MFQHKLSSTQNLCFHLCTHKSGALGAEIEAERDEQLPYFGIVKEECITGSSSGGLRSSGLIKTSFEQKMVENSRVQSQKYPNQKMNKCKIPKGIKNPLSCHFLSFLSRFHGIQTITSQEKTNLIYVKSFSIIKSHLTRLKKREFSNLSTIISRKHDNPSFFLTKNQHRTGIIKIITYFMTFTSGLIIKSYCVHIQSGRFHGTLKNQIKNFFFLFLGYFVFIAVGLFS